MAHEEDLDDLDLEREIFPLLRECLQQVDTDLGFNIEIKFPMPLSNGLLEMDNFFEPNFYVDHILAEIFQYADNRKIVISCFCPDICAMVNLKQNRYPVLLLGAVKEFSDLRVVNCENTISVASAEQFLGVALDAEMLLAAPQDLVSYAKDKLNKIIFVWGEKNNSQENREELKKRGVHGVIYDRLQEQHDEGTLNFRKMKKIINEVNQPNLLFPASGDEEKSVTAYSDSECYSFKSEGLTIAGPHPGKVKFPTQKRPVVLENNSPRFPEESQRNIST